MRIELWCIGKTAFDYLDEGIALYQKRLKHYTAFDWVVLPDVKNAKSLSHEQLRTQEGLLVLQKLQNDDFLVLLDERGKEFASVQLAAYIEKMQLQAVKRVVFLIGGAFGFSEAVYARANAQISLSKLTFSHQMVRLFFIEQLYRAFTIINGEPYHHQ
jgi:23S rRNA (pseudouridine1915-N3)-methyltransferase